MLTCDNDEVTVQLSPCSVEVHTDDCSDEVLCSVEVYADCDND